MAYHKGKANHTGHKGSGRKTGYWGKRVDAKLESKKSRRQHDKITTKEAS